MELPKGEEPQSTPPLSRGPGNRPRRKGEPDDKGQPRGRFDIAPVRRPKGHPGREVLRPVSEWEEDDAEQTDDDVDFSPPPLRDVDELEDQDLEPEQPTGPGQIREELPSATSPVQEPNQDQDNKKVDDIKNVAQKAEKTAENAKKVVQTAKKVAEAGAKIARAGEAAATAAGTVEIWGPVLIVVIFIIAGLIIFGLAYAFLIKKPQTGSTDPQAVKVGDAATENTIASLAAYAGDSEYRAKLARQDLGDLPNKLDRAETEIKGAYYEHDMQDAINQARAQMDIIKSGRPASEAGSAQASQNAITDLFKDLDRLVALNEGINILSAKDIVERAKQTISENTSNWVFTNNQKPDDPTYPLRDGSNVKNNKRGCNSAGFGTYVLRRHPTNPETTTYLLYYTPGYDNFAAHYNFIFNTQTITEQPDTANLLPGDVLLASKKEGDKTNKYLYLVLGDQTGDGTSEIAYCAATSNAGPSQGSINLISQDKETINQILRYKYVN